MSKKKKHKKRFPTPDRQQAGRGAPCPRCRQATTRFEHTAAFKPPVSAGYYRFWFRCDNRGCKTTLIMPSEGYVKPGYAKQRDPLDQKQAQHPQAWRILPPAPVDPLDEKLREEAASLAAFTANRL